MNRDELKKRLYGYGDLQAEHRQITQELERVEAIMTAPRSPNMDGMPRAGGPGDPVLGIVSQHMALLDRYQKQLEKLAAAQNAIEDMIESLEPTARRIMRFRYIDGLTWEAVCVAVGYSWSQTHEYHAKALDALLAAEIEKEVTPCT